MTIFKQRARAHTDAIKRQISKYIEHASPADHVSVTTALLELGFERQLDLHDEEDARDLVDRAFHRVAQTRRGTLQ